MRLQSGFGLGRDREETQLWQRLRIGREMEGSEKQREAVNAAQSGSEVEGFSPLDHDLFTVHRAEIFLGRH